MKNKACCWVLIILGILFLLVFVGGGIAISTMIAKGDKTSTIEDNSYLVLELTGPLTEYSTQPSLDFLGMSSSSTVADIWRALRSAAKDPKIKGVVIRPMGIGGFAEIRELRTALSEFKKSGKRLYAHLDVATDRDYYLASVADTISMNPARSGGMIWTGLGISSTYMAKTFEKLGIRFHALHIGDYKGAFENYSRDSMSEPLRESLQFILDDLYTTYTKEIASGRATASLDSINAQLLHGKSLFQLGSAAKAAGLVDVLGDWQDFKERVKQGKEFEGVTLSRYLRTIHSAVPSTDEVAVVFAEGAITYKGEDGMNLSDEGITAHKFVKELRKVRDDDHIKSVVLRVNSPGGSAFASEVILQEVLRLKAKKPVVVSMGNVAASGGYYISCCANAIVAQPNTITGSIGVVSLIPSAEELYKKIGARVETVDKGKWANFFRLDRDLNAEQQTVLINYMKGVYDEFVDHVAAGRGVPRDSVERYASGRIWTGTQALDRHLVDELGGLDTAIERAKTLAGLSGKEVKIKFYPRQKDFFSFVISRLDSYASVLSSHSWLLAPSELEAQRIVDFLTGYMRQRDYVQAVLPIDLP